MQNKIRRYGIAFLAVALLSACSKVPDEILSEKEMQKIMVDMQLAEAMIGADYKTYKEDIQKEALYQSVFRKHDITQAMYDSSLVWYGKNLDIYLQVYERVLADLDKRVIALGDVQADAGPTSLKDSVNIWPRRSLLVLEPRALFNGVTFDIRPEANYSSGSSFVLGMDVWGVSKQMQNKPEIRLSVEQGDTTITVNDTIFSDGYHEVILRSLPTKQVKRVYGFIRMDNADTVYYKVYMDSLSLMKYNYASLALEQAKDSIQ